jgi:hypothetical protein
MQLLPVYLKLPTKNLHFWLASFHSDLKYYLFSHRTFLFNLQVPSVSVTSEAVVSDDGIFKVTVGPATSVASPQQYAESSSGAQHVFTPSPRMNCGLVVKHGILYLYGGLVEDGDKQFTLSDFYSLGMTHSVYIT